MTVLPKVSGTARGPRVDRADNLLGPMVIGPQISGVIGLLRVIGPRAVLQGLVPMATDLLVNGMDLGPKGDPVVPAMGLVPVARAVPAMGLVPVARGMVLVPVVLGTVLVPAARVVLGMVLVPAASDLVLAPVAEHPLPT